ncbi:MAG: hypothetical protein ROW52_00050 [Anaerolineaceae bacterium]
MEHAKVRDNRSGKIIFLSHCCLNQNAKVRGIANYPGAIRPLVELLLDEEVGMFQMPCPEMSYIGAMRWGQVKDQYNSPMFRRHCHSLAEKVADQMEEYHRSGYQVLGVVMIDGSPVCGLHKTPQPADAKQMWGGMTWYVPEQIAVADRGVYCEALQQEQRQRPGLENLPYVSVPELKELGSFEEALQQIRALLQSA